MANIKYLDNSSFLVQNDDVEILAADDCIVIFAKFDTTTNLFLLKLRYVSKIIEYSNLVEIRVMEGQKVLKGQIIGLKERK